MALAPGKCAGYSDPRKRRPYTEVCVFPLRDENPTILTPIITILMVVANVAVWILIQGAGTSMEVLSDSVCRYGAIPAEITGKFRHAANSLACVRRLDLPSRQPISIEVKRPGRPKGGSKCECWWSRTIPRRAT